jgi:hypothetical protein
MLGLKESFTKFFLKCERLIGVVFRNIEVTIGRGSSVIIQTPQTVSIACNLKAIAI